MHVFSCFSNCQTKTQLNAFWAHKCGKFQILSKNNLWSQLRAWSVLWTSGHDTASSANPARLGWSQQRCQESQRLYTTHRVNYKYRSQTLENKLVKNDFRRDRSTCLKIWLDHKKNPEDLHYLLKLKISTLHYTLNSLIGGVRLEAC